MEYYVLEQPASTGPSNYDYLIVYRADNDPLWRHVYFWGEQKLFGGRFIPLAVANLSTTSMSRREVDTMIQQHRDHGWRIIDRNAYWCGSDHGLTYSLRNALGTVPFWAPVALMWSWVSGVLSAIFTMNSVTASVPQSDQGHGLDDGGWGKGSFGVFNRSPFGVDDQSEQIAPGFIDLDLARDFYWPEDLFDTCSCTGSDSMFDGW